MAEIKFEITDDMICSVIEKQVKEKIKNMDIKGIIESETRKCAHDLWKELNANELVKFIKVNEVTNKIASEISHYIGSKIAQSFDEDY